MANGDRARQGQIIAAEEATGGGDAGRQALESIMAQSGGGGGRQQGRAPRQQAQKRSPSRQQMQVSVSGDRGQAGAREMGGDIVAELAQRAQQAAAGGPNQQRRQWQQKRGLGPVEGPEDTLERRIRRLEAVRVGQTEPGRAFQEELARKAVDNIIQTPQVIGNLLAAGSAGIRSMWGIGSDLAEGGLGEVGRGLAERFPQAFEEEQQQLPARALRELSQQAPSATDVQAGVRTAAQGVSGEEGPGFEELQTRFEDRRIQQQEEQPLASDLGGAVADAATVLTGRAPFTRGPRRRAMQEFKNPKSTVPANPDTDMPPGVRRQIRQIMQGGLSKSLRTGARQTGSAGLEGSVVALLNDGDPAQMAGFAAGAEATRNILTGGAKHIIKNPAGIGGALMSTAAIWQIMKEGTPGGNDYILESFETSSEKMLGTLALGGLSLTLGGAKPSRQLTENIPIRADAIRTVPRNVVNSMANNLLSYEEPPSEDVDAAFQEFVRNPDAFGRTARRRLERSIRSEKTDPRAEIENLIDNSPSFRDRLEELRTPEGAEP